MATKLSTGDPSTLEFYRSNAIAVWGLDSVQRRYIDLLISNEPNGKDTEVEIDEQQFIFLLSEMMNGTAYDIRLKEMLNEIEKEN